MTDFNAESALHGEDGCRRAAIGSAVSEPGGRSHEPFNETQPGERQIGEVGILRNEVNGIIRAGTEYTDMVEVEHLVLLFASTIMGNKILF